MAFTSTTTDIAVNWKKNIIQHYVYYIVLWLVWGMYSNCYPWLASVASSNLMFIPGTKMALLVKDAHILYYNIDTFQSIMLGRDYFTSPDYLVLKSWIHVTFLF